MLLQVVALGGLEGGREERGEVVHPALWEEREVESGLRNLCYLSYKREEAFTVLVSGERAEVEAELGGILEGGGDPGPALLVGHRRLGVRGAGQQIVHCIALYGLVEV